MPVTELLTLSKSSLEKGIYAALESYANVHRGSGHFSHITTHIFDEARNHVLNYLNLDHKKYLAIFTTPFGEKAFKSQFDEVHVRVIGSDEIGLALGVRVLVIKKSDIPKGEPSVSGGGTAKLTSADWVIWARNAEKFEAGTPAVINILYYTRALIAIKSDGMKPMNFALKEDTANSSFDEEWRNLSGLELLEKVQQSMIGANYMVPTMQGLQPFVNLDNSASTPTYDLIWSIFNKALSLSQEAQQKMIRHTRKVLADFVNAPESEYDVLFASNTTEAINLLARSFENAGEAGKIMNSSMEHTSNDLPWRLLNNHELIRLSADNDGFFSTEEIEQKLLTYTSNGQPASASIKLVAITGASNVMGVCNNIKEISRIVHKHGALLMVDAAQLIAHRSIDMVDWGIDFMVFSGHKIYAPFGSGALLARRGLLNFSKEQLDEIRHDGDENAAGIIALGKSLTMMQRIGMDLIEEEEQKITAYALAEMSKVKGMRIRGIDAHDHPEITNKLGVILFDIEGKMADVISKKLMHQSGIGTRYGCHCAHIMVKQVSGVGPKLEKFQWLMQSVLPNMQLPGLSRVSFGLQTTTEDIDRLCDGLKHISLNSKEDAFAVKMDVVKKQVSELLNAVGKTVFELE